jgi:hypothetical protein
MIHHNTHVVEVTEESAEKVKMIVSTNEGIILGEFSIAKHPEQTADEAAQGAYNSAYGKVGG